MTRVSILATYLTLADFGDAMTSAQMADVLSRMSRRDVLYLLADLNHRADPRVSNLEFQLGLAQRLLPRRLLRKATRMLSEGQKVLTYPQIILNLALRAMVSCPAEQDDRLPAELSDSDRREIGRLLLAEATLINEAQVVPGATAEDNIASAILEVTRSDLLARTYWHPGVFEEAFEVLFKHLPALSPQQRLVDPCEVVKAKLGFEFRELWAMSAFASMMAFGSEHCPVYPSAVGYGDLKRPALLDEWIDFWSVHADEAATMAQHDLEVATGWSFEAFRRQPLLRLSPSCILPVRTTYLAEKATLNGAVWTILDLLDGNDRLDWLNTVGRAFESYARDRLRREIGGVTEIIWEEDVDARWGVGSHCDAIVVYDTRGWMPIEFVSRNPTVQTKVSGDYSDLETDIRRAAIEKLVQIDGTLKRAAEHESLPRLIVPVVVIGGQFPSNPVTHQALVDALTEAEMCVLGADRRCVPPALMESHDFMLLLHAARVLRKPAFRLVEQWQRSREASMPFSTWLGGKHPEMERRRDGDWLETATGWLLKVESRNVV